MKKRSYLGLLIFCAVLSQGIAGSLVEDMDGSSDLHIRQKRVVNLRKNGDGASSIASVPYIVNIRKDNISQCAGSILSAVFVLTVYKCVYPEDIGQYTILSGSEYRDLGTLHNISKRMIVGPSQDLVLVALSPNINFNESRNRPISLFTGVIHHPTYGIFSGWGCTVPGETFAHTPVYPEQLMQVRLPLMPLEQCAAHYDRRIRITNRDMCTLDEAKRRGACIGDSGNPLAIRIPPTYVHELIGVMTHVRGMIFGKDPDIFNNLNHLDIREWITNEIQNNV